MPKVERQTALVFGVKCFIVLRRVFWLLNDPGVLNSSQLHVLSFESAFEFRIQFHLLEIVFINQKRVDKTSYLEGPEGSNYRRSFGQFLGYNLRITPESFFPCRVHGCQKIPELPTILSQKSDYNRSNVNLRILVLLLTISE